MVKNHWNQWNRVFHCRGTGWIPGQATQVPRAAWCDQKTEENKKVTPLALVGGVLLN